MKKYEYPECGGEMITDKTYSNMKICNSCWRCIDEDFLIYIQKLKQQVQKMKSCENCNVIWCRKRNGVVSNTKMEICIRKDRNHWQPRP